MPADCPSSDLRCSNLLQLPRPTQPDLRPSLVAFNLAVCDTDSVALNHEFDFGTP